MKKIMICLMMAVMLVTANVYAANAAFPNESGSVGRLETVVGNTWQTASTVIQVLAVACVVFAGVRYMFASAEKRADIKRGLSFLIIGSVFIFAAATVARFIVSAGNYVI